jgi:hypothetical protein
MSNLEEVSVASDHNSAALNVGHNLFTLRLVILDLVSGFMRDPNERRYISSSKAEIAHAISDLSQMLEQIERADTSQQVSRIRLSELPRALLETPRREPPYGPMCRNPSLCAGKGWCPRNPTCGD